MKNVALVVGLSIAAMMLSLTGCSKSAPKEDAPAAQTQSSDPAAILKDTKLTSEQEAAVKQAEEAAAKANEENAKNGNS